MCNKRQGPCPVAPDVLCGTTSWLFTATASVWSHDVDCAKITVEFAEITAIINHNQKTKNSEETQHVTSYEA